MNKKLIRVWNRYYDPCGQQFVAWNHGTFTIPADDPLAIELWDNRELGHHITVESTDEMAWWIDRIDKIDNLNTLIVTCRPHIDVIRDYTIPDWKLVSAWLEAEKVYRQNRSPAARTLNVLERTQALLAEMTAEAAADNAYETVNGFVQTRPDRTWRIIGRTVAQNVHPAVDGQDCYVFKREGGTRPTDIWSVTYHQPVDWFWK